MPDKSVTYTRNPLPNIAVPPTTLLNNRTLLAIFFAVLAWGSVGFHLYLVVAGLMPNLISRPLHLFFVLPWIFFYPWYRAASRQQPPPSKPIGAIKKVWSLICGVLGMGICLYIVIYQETLSEQYGTLYGAGQFIMAISLLFLVLEMARRIIHWPLPTVAALAMLYGLLGHWLPGDLGFGRIPAASFLGTLTLSEGGVWGQLTGISATIVAIFVILGAVVNQGEAGLGFMMLASKIAGPYRGGAAKVSVIASALFGSVSGSASANVASTGAVTLPTMKRLGYPSAFAAATEAVASTGGQIMPPLMGAGAFVMVELLAVPYTTILQAALLPSVLFFFAVWIGVDSFAKRYQLKPMQADELPSARQLWQTVPFFALPFSLLLVLLFYRGYSAQLSAFYAVICAAILLLFGYQKRVIYLQLIDGSAEISQEVIQFSIALGLKRLNQAVLTAAEQIAGIAAIIICAGIIVGVLHQTGLGIKITSLILSLAGERLWVALLLTALACLILGMEVPTTAAYLICISVAGPALQQLGVPALHAHFFVFWFALLSTITPPVCGTVFIAAGMAGAPWLATAMIAMRLGLGLYFIPLALVAQPALLQPIAEPLLALLAMIRVGLALWLLSLVSIARDTQALVPIPAAGATSTLMSSQYGGRIGKTIKSLVLVALAAGLLFYSV